MYQLSKLEIIVFRLLPKALMFRALPRLKRFAFFRETANTQTPIGITAWYNQKIRRVASEAYWPVHSTSLVIGWKNIYCGIETCPGYMPGNYIQAIGKIYIGDYTQIAPNVGIISANHDVYDNRKHLPTEVRIGKYCWIGMGAIILPGVQLGDFTIVAAGAIVTKPFKEGYCIIGGNPAKIIKHLEKNLCIQHTSHYEYNGYIPSEKFETFRKTHLNV